jgi:hypothetical protein
VRRDPREPRRVDFTLHALLKPRGWPRAAGSEDATDATTLRHAPLFTVRRERVPARAPPVASQPTLSRCANRVSRPALSRLARVLVAPLLAADDRPPTRIVLACDDTEDPAPGAQEPRRYEGYSGGSGRLPLHVDEGLSGRLIPTLFKAKRFRAAQRLGGLQRLRKGRRQAWPAPLRIVRGDRPLASPEVRPWLEAQAHLHAVTGVTSTRVLHPLAHEGVAQAKRAYGRAGGKVTRFHATRSQAGTWSPPRRVVSTVEGSAQGVNPRLVVPDLEPARAQGLSRPRSGARGQAANERQEHTRSVPSARTSCHRVEAKQCRLFWPAAASGVLDTLRREVCQGTPGAGATMEPLQGRGLTLGARVQAGTDRLTRAWPSSCPVAPVLRRSLTFWACGRLTSQALCERSRAHAADVPSHGGRLQEAGRMPCARSRPSDRCGRCQDDLTRWF